ncbi:hypothetical protein [Leptospira noguchii]|uniref:hypothetical protein n=1 Tax=Leptospira noguchii TaxID=28182 RepID=UPI0002F44DD9|nr:hypothetical protein [Leptospira noguchii]
MKNSEGIGAKTNNSMKRFLRKRLKLSVSLLGSLGKLKTLLPAVATLGREPVHYEICELLRRPGKLSERLPMGRRSGSRCT